MYVEYGVSDSLVQPAVDITKCLWGLHGCWFMTSGITIYPHKSWDMWFSKCEHGVWYKLWVLCLQVCVCLSTGRKGLMLFEGVNVRMHTSEHASHTHLSCFWIASAQKSSRPHGLLISILHQATCWDFVWHWWILIYTNTLQSNQRHFQIGNSGVLRPYYSEACSSPQGSLHSYSSGTS